MTPEPPRIEWEKAVSIGTAIQDIFDAYCSRSIIAGSVRRLKPLVKDIEILCIPKPAEGQRDLFGNVLDDQADALTLYLRGAVREGKSWALRPNIRGGTTFGTLNKLMLYEGTPVDIFTGTVANLGRDLWVRTGPAEWNMATAKRAIELGMKFHAYGDAAFTRDWKPVSCATEDAFAHVLGLAAAPRPELRGNEWPR